ncbi:MAG: VOC family protein [Vulcanimicrobiaceae bacterium]
MPQIAPLLWFNDEAEEAANYYASVVPNSKIENVSRYGEAGPGRNGSVMMVEFQLDGQDFLALNGGEYAGVPSTSTPPRGAIALFTTCATQAELDQLWEKLSDGGEILQCGWLKDKYGFAWNIVPAGLGEVLGDPDPIKRERAMKAMLQMVKLDIDELRRAAESASSDVPAAAQAPSARG